MRIISGALRRRKIKVPPGSSVRPTTDRTREAIFNSLTGRVSLQEAAVADLFAGSGALGFEAISRGALAVVFVESDGRTMKVIQENALALNVVDRCEFVRQDAARYLERIGAETFDVVFADPPYGFQGISEIVDRGVRTLKPGGFLILEHDRRRQFGDVPSFVSHRDYGDTRVSVFQPPGID